MQKGTVYIVGVDHLIQYRNSMVPDNIFTRFTEYLLELTVKYNISVIAEEFHSEYLTEVYFSSEAVVETAAEKAGVIHVFCDPGEAERFSLGIPYFADIRDDIKDKYGIYGKYISDRLLREKIESETTEESKRYWNIREEYWYSKIAEYEDRNILFVCGHEHVYRLRKLLSGKGRSAEVVDQFWHGEIFPFFHPRD